MDDKDANTCSKRKNINDDIDEDSVVLKKARYSWQVKSTFPSIPTRTDNGSLVIQNSDDLSVTLSNSYYTENLENKDKINSQKEFQELKINENATPDHISVYLDKEKKYLDKVDTFSSFLNGCQKPTDNSTPSTSKSHISELGNQVTCPTNSSTDNATKGNKKDLSVYLSELENENLHKPSLYPSHPDISVTSLSSSGQRSEDIFNSSDSEAEEEGLLFSSPQRCTNSLDFDLHLARWQNQHAAKAIVDNAINKTLEEMGVSPEEDLDEFAADKYYVEDEGISEAIRRQGLVCQPEDKGTYIRQGNGHVSVDEQSSVEELQNSEEVVNLQDKERSSLIHTDPGPHSDLHGKNESQRELHQIAISQNSMFSSLHCASEELLAKSSSRSESLTVSPSSYHSDVYVPVSNNDLIDQAVTMAICSQGLALQNNVL